MEDTMLIVCKYNGKSVDLIVPSDILADQLVAIANEKLRPSSIYEQFALCENPPRLIVGSVPISALGLHDGSILSL